ncbi:MAG: FAD-binding oxidoreductase [Fimbriimonadaceae bacterium]
MKTFSLTDLKDRLQDGGVFRVQGTGSSSTWLPPSNVEPVTLDRFDQVVDYRPDDLVIRVGSGMLLDELFDMTAKDGLCLPILRNRGWLGYAGKTVGGLVGLGLPHYGAGSVRDWVMGVKFMTGSGEVIESGANVVKSVAGFDMHRMLVGSRGELGVILELALRLYPVRMMPIADGLPVMGDGSWISRVPKSFPGEEGVRSPNGEWIWSERRLDIPPLGWAIGPNGQRVGVRDEIGERFRANLKNVLDPKGVFERGWIR